MNHSSFNSEALNEACRAGSVAVLDYFLLLASQNQINLRTIGQQNIMFTDLCSYGLLEDAKWVLSHQEQLGPIDIHYQQEKPFSQALHNSHWEVADWLLSLGPIDIHLNNNHLFKTACQEHRLDIVEYLHRLDPELEYQVIEDQIIPRDWHSLIKDLDNPLDILSALNIQKEASDGIERNCLICLEPCNYLIRPCEHQHYFCLAEGLKWYENHFLCCQICQKAFRWSDCYYL